MCNLNINISISYELNYLTDVNLIVFLMSHLKDAASKTFKNSILLLLYPSLLGGREQLVGHSDRIKLSLQFWMI